MAIEVTWARGWDARKLAAYASPEQVLRDHYWDGHARFDEPVRAWGLKAPSHWVGSTRLDDSLREGRWISRRSTLVHRWDAERRSWVNTQLEPVPCSAAAVHAALSTQFQAGWAARGWSTEPARVFKAPRAYVVVMTAWGIHGSQPDTLKLYGKSYRVVARVETPDLSPLHEWEDERVWADVLR